MRFPCIYSFVNALAKLQLAIQFQDYSCHVFFSSFVNTMHITCHFDQRLREEECNNETNHVAALFSIQLNYIFLQSLELLTSTLIIYVIMQNFSSWVQILCCNCFDVSIKPSSAKFCVIRHQIICALYSLKQANQRASSCIENQ